MHTPFDDILFFDDLSPDRQEALRAACGNEPALAEALAQWNEVRTAVRRRLATTVPDRRLVVLYALERAGRSDLLSAGERAELEEAHDDLATAFEAVPALTDVTSDVEQACADFEAVWDAHLAAYAPAEHRAPDRRARLHAARGRTPRTPASRRPVLRWAWRGAAVAAVAAFVAIVFTLVQRDRGMTTIEVAQGSTRVVELADGSTVRLLGGSSLTYAPADGASSFARRVRLTGRAFFEIAPKQQGFTVETPTALTTVLGTSFGIQADQQRMRVVLATGRISVASVEAQDRMVVLEPGQMTEVAQHALPSTPQEVDLAEALSWTGLLVFRAKPLAEVAARLSRDYGRSVSVAPSLAGERITGTFDREQTLEEVLETLATTLGASVRGNADAGFQLLPRGD